MNVIITICRKTLRDKTMEGVMQKFDYNRIKDPAFFAQNRVGAHSDHKFYANECDLVEGK